MTTCERRIYIPSFLQGDNAPAILLPGVAGVCLMTEDAAAAKLRANLKRIKGKLTDVNQLISQYTQVKQEKLTLLIRQLRAFGSILWKRAGPWA